MFLERVLSWRFPLAFMAAACGSADESQGCQTNYDCREGRVCEYDPQAGERYCMDSVSSSQSDHPGGRGSSSSPSKNDKSSNDYFCNYQGKIAFVASRLDNRRGIFAINGDGTGLYNITNNPDGIPIDRGPSWSPDGSRLTFFSDRSGNRDIYTVDSGGGNLRQLTTNIYYDYSPAWSPDGQMIAFVSEREEEGDGIYEGPRPYVMDVDGSNQHRITEEITGVTVISWSPTSESLAMSGSGPLYIVNVSGSGARVLADKYTIEPAWSPTDDWIAYARSGRYRRISLISPRGGPSQEFPTVLSQPEMAWSPDGRALALISRTEAGEKLVKGELEGRSISVILLDNPSHRCLVLRGIDYPGLEALASPSWVQ